jgi:hypothetical protein
MDILQSGLQESKRLDVCVELLLCPAAIELALNIDPPGHRVLVDGPRHNRLGCEVLTELFVREQILQRDQLSSSVST